MGGEEDVMENDEVSEATRAARVGVVAFLAVGAVVGAYSLYATSRSAPPAIVRPEPPPPPAVAQQQVAAPQQKPPATEVPAIEVTAVQLHADYDANEVAADAKYRGQRVRVTGKVASIDKDALGAIVVSLRTRGAFEPVRATIYEEHADRVAALHKGDLVALFCVGGMRIMGSPGLDRCFVSAEAPQEDKPRPRRRTLVDERGRRYHMEGELMVFDD